jgi:ATP-dependent Clp protease ATP-binding subunit ClpX
MLPSSRTRDDRGEFLAFIAGLPTLSPRQVFEILGEQGYCGQEKPRRLISLMAYRHVKRLKQIYLYGIPREQLPPKQNVLCIGPTGCGKTYLVELLFEHILQMPTVIVDITSYSETGYVGQDVNSLLTNLLYTAPANMNPLIASVGVICLDEFDKLAASTSAVRFAGQGTTKDVSGFGVQRELLKMLEGGEVTIPLDFGLSTYSSRAVISTRDIPFLACGAFSGIAEISRRRAGGSIGFGRKGRAVRLEDKIAIALEDGEVEDVANFQQYGFLPEMMGRFTTVVNFAPLDAETLRTILERNVIGQFEKEFADEGLELIIAEEVIEAVVRGALRKETGARGLNAMLTKHLEEAAFEAFGTRGVAGADLAGGEVRLELEGDEIVTRVLPGGRKVKYRQGDKTEP